MCIIPSKRQDVSSYRPHSVASQHTRIVKTGAMATVNLAFKNDVSFFSASQSVSVHVWSASDTSTPAFYLCLFYDAVSISDCKTSRGRMIMNNEWNGIWKEAFVAAVSKYRI